MAFYFSMVFLFLGNFHAASFNSNLILAHPLKRNQMVSHLQCMLFFFLGKGLGLSQKTFSLTTSSALARAMKKRFELI